MIIPILCFGCGKPTGHLWEKYVDLVKKYRSEEGNSSEAAQKKLTQPSPEGKAMDELGMTRECCRMIFYCNADISLDISSP